MTFGEWTVKRRTSGGSFGSMTDGSPRLYGGRDGGTVSTATDYAGKMSRLQE